jgi:hypothetical protein
MRADDAASGKVLSTQLQCQAQQEENGIICCAALNFDWKSNWQRLSGDYSTGIVIERMCLEVNR